MIIFLYGNTVKGFIINLLRATHTSYTHNVQLKSGKVRLAHMQVHWTKRERMKKRTLRENVKLQIPLYGPDVYFYAVHILQFQVDILMVFHVMLQKQSYGHVSCRRTLFKIFSAYLCPKYFQLNQNIISKSSYIFSNFGLQFRKSISWCLIFNCRPNFHDILHLCCSILG